MIPSEPEQQSVHSSITDAMVEAAAGGLWDHRELEERRWHVVSDEPVHEDPLWAEVVTNGLFPSGQREVRAEARAALEAALEEPS